jgi:Tfp pilus assembly protein PilN
VEVAQEQAVSAAAIVKLPAKGMRKWLAIGTGIGVEAVGADLLVTVVRVRPSGVAIAGATVISNYAGRPAAEWGAEYAAFAQKCQARRQPITFLLPRHEVIVRHLVLPGVDDKDLGAAVAYQADSLHPYPEDSVALAWARLGATPTVLVAITGREVVDRFSSLFNEAGIRMSGFSLSAPALYSASRILVTPPESFLAFHSIPGMLEAYGESPARPVFSGTFEEHTERVHSRALAELRLDPDVPAASFSGLLASPTRQPSDLDVETFALPFAAAICNACPRLCLPLNLLPEDRRTASSGLVYIPTMALSLLLLATAFLLGYQQSWQDKQYLARLNEQIRTLDKQAAKSPLLDKQTQLARDRIAILDRYRGRPQADAGALREITNLLQPPAWIQSLALTRTEVMFSGEAEQAAPLLKVIDDSPLFRDSTFAQTMARIGTAAEQFNIRTAREGPGTGFEEGEQR